jgi:hypothetical protein
MTARKGVKKQTATSYDKLQFMTGRFPNAALYQAEPQPEMSDLQRDMTIFAKAFSPLVT